MNFGHIHNNDRYSIILSYEKMMLMYYWRKYIILDMTTKTYIVLYERFVMQTCSNML